MTRKLISLLVLAAMLCTLFAGCVQIGEIAGNVADAAAKELENQLKATVEKHKVDVVEMKTAVGRLCGDDEKALQFFGAVLIRSQSETAADTVVTALKSLFAEAGATAQTGSAIESEYLVHKTLAYDHTDFSGGNYYTVYVFSSIYTGKT